jgi:DNA replication initiation complex subunit (GINS family)
MNNSKNLIKKEESLFSKLANIREENNGTITFHFESVNTFNDYQGDSDPKSHKKPVITKCEESVVKWSQIQPINKEIFFNEKGKRLPLKEVAQLLVDLTNDRGAKYFTI